VTGQCAGRRPGGKVTKGEFPARLHEGKMVSLPFFSGGTCTPVCSPRTAKIATIWLLQNRHFFAHFIFILKK
jgi:hypothetical protein